MKLVKLSKLVLASTVLVIGSGCATVRLSGFDKVANTVTIETSNNNESKAHAEAEKYCGSEAELLKMTEQAIGKQSHLNSDATVVTTYDVHHSYYTYRCK